MTVEKAYAKINTYLNVASRRGDGYHNIVSIMQTVSLCDLVSVDLHEAECTDIRLSVVGNDTLPRDRGNLAWRAAEAFLEKCNRTGRVEIRIEKRIPMAAGLAGGSADAAAVLRALYGLCNAPFPQEDLYALGATLGADVPFCIRCGCSLVEGIGERLTEAPGMPDCHLVVARLGDGVSTPWAYGTLDETYGDFSEVAGDVRYKAILDTWRDGRLADSCENFFNIFESVVLPQRPLVDTVKQVMIGAGAIRAMMSGSGPSVFGVFPSSESAEAAFEKLLCMGASAYVCHPVP